MVVREVHGVHSRGGGVRVLQLWNERQDCPAHGLPQPPPASQWQINICETCAQSEKKKRCNYVISNEF